MKTKQQTKITVSNFIDKLLIESKSVLDVLKEDKDYSKKNNIVQNEKEIDWSDKMNKMTVSYIRDLKIDKKKYLKENKITNHLLNLLILYVENGTYIFEK